MHSGKWRRVDWSTVATLVYCAVLIYLVVMRAGGVRAPLDMRLWRALMVLCQRSAAVIGQAGMVAEKAYWSAAERVRGGY